MEEPNTAPLPAQESTAAAPRPQGPSLHEWAASGSPTAEDRLAQLESGDAAGSAKHPFRMIDREAYLAVVKGAGIARRSLEAPVALVNLDDLVAIQGTINAERVGHHLSDPALYQPGARAPGHGMLVDRPVVVRKNGMLFIHDGHHRLTARFLRGASTAKVRLVDLDTA